MALETLGTEQKTYEQFEDCKRDENCVYRDVNGKCIFETCIFDNEHPVHAVLWYFKCIACGSIDSIKPRDMKIHMCKSCIEHLQNSIKPKATCCICGSSIGSYTKAGFAVCICDSCVSRLRKAAFCKECGN